jgi:hypothetical protein
MSENENKPGEWLRNGLTVYTLMHAGWRKGIELFKNRITIQIHHDRECSEEEACAAARLIAAAPDLLEACKAVASGDENFHELIRAAIAKATGAES